MRKPVMPVKKSENSKRSKGSAIEKTTTSRFGRDAHQRLREEGLRITRPREMVIELLAKTKIPLSAPELFKKLKSQSPHGVVDQVTIYRILEQFKALGLVHEAFPSKGLLACSHSRCATPYHLLLSCTACGSVIEKGDEGSLTTEFLNHIEKTLQFRIETHPLHLLGRCQKCER